MNVLSQCLTHHKPHRTSLGMITLQNDRAPSCTARVSLDYLDQHVGRRSEVAYKTPPS